MSKQSENKPNKPVAGKIAAWTFVVAMVTLGGWGLTQMPAQAEDIVVYKSPTCGCCNAWISHLKDNGFTVEVHDRLNMNPIKAEMGVPYQFRSCHTAKVGDYVIEGHVPADVITRLLKEKPPVKGLAVPGMPMGSPGMEGPRKDPYDVMTFNEQGRATVYESR